MNPNNDQKQYVYGGPKRSKYAFLYTVHGAFDELDLNVTFFNRSEFLCENFDVVINCNSGENERTKASAQSFKVNRATVLFDSVNEGGHHMGPPEQIDNSYDELLGYELVLQLHADVYVISDHGLKNFVSDYESNPGEAPDYYTFALPDRDRQYASDAFIFRPLKGNNVFKDWKNYSPRAAGAEPYLYDALEANQMSVGLFDRGPCAAMNQEYEPNSGLLDTEHINKARSFLN